VKIHPHLAEVARALLQLRDAKIYYLTTPKL